MKRSDWTPASDDALRNHLAAGRSHLEAMAKINAEFKTNFSRNACIGRARRQGIPSRERVVDVAKPRNPSARKPRTTPAQRPDIAIRKAASGPKLPTQPAQLRCDPVKAGEVTLFDLREGMCKWPTGDGAANLRFCGLWPEDGRPYCTAHCQIAYRRAA